MHIELWDY